MSVPHIEFEGVAARIGAATILRDVDFAVAAGESVGLFGANGAGKTTLLRLIATLIPPSAGIARVLEADLATHARFDIRSRVGLIGHNPALYPELSLLGNLEFSARVAGAPLPAAREALAAGGDVFELFVGLHVPAVEDVQGHGVVELVEHIVAGVLDRGGAVVLVSHDVARVAPMVTRTAELAGGTVR